jgi:hypothetical protein
VIEFAGHFWHRSSVSSCGGHVLTIVGNGQNNLQVRHVRSPRLGRCSLVRGAPELVPNDQRAVIFGGGCKLSPPPSETLPALAGGVR